MKKKKRKGNNRGGEGGDDDIVDTFFHSPFVFTQVPGLPDEETKMAIKRLA